MSYEFRASLKYGLNAAPGICFFCDGEDGTTVLSGRIGMDERAPAEGRCVTLRPCQACQAVMATDIILIGVVSTDDSQVGLPIRYGEPLVVDELTVVNNVLDPQRRAHILRERWAFVEKDAFDLLTLEGD